VLFPAPPSSSFSPPHPCCVSRSSKLEGKEKTGASSSRNCSASLRFPDWHICHSRSWELACICTASACSWSSVVFERLRQPRPNASTEGSNYHRYVTTFFCLEQTSSYFLNGFSLQPSSNPRLFRFARWCIDSYFRYQLWFL
jgi:hypothetical protein